MAAEIPRPGTGEHWAEKIAAELGVLIGVNTAQVELAKCAGELGTICRSFVPAEGGESGLEEVQYTLFHGWEILENDIEGYDASIRFGQREHSVKNIAKAIAPITGYQTPHGGWALEDLASYVMLDGLIGNTDRHHENWIISYIYDAGNVEVLAAPSFDHASSLGRELTDERRRQIIADDRILHYLLRGRGGVFVDARRRRALPPLRLAQLICRWAPDFTRMTLDNINAVSESDIREIIDRVPPEVYVQRRQRIRLPSGNHQQSRTATEHPMTTLYLAWQDQRRRRWFPVGRLVHGEKGLAEYEFTYVDGASQASEIAQFRGIPGFPELEGHYKSPCYSRRSAIG